MSIPNSWLFPYDRSFSAVDWLAAHSPRAWDTPDFGKWIEEAAAQNRISQRWLLMTAEKEQSFITRRAGGPGWDRAVKWTMGYGATDGGDIPRFAGTENQVRSAAKGLRGYLTRGHPLYVGDLLGKPFRCLDGYYTPSTLAEAAQLRYTPWIKYLPDTVRVWESLFGKEAVMASGYSNLHPQQEAILREIGIPSADVTQAWGYATASAGYHEPEGTASNGKPFSSCFDLRATWAEREPLNRLVQASVCPFVRTRETGWTKGAHIHCVSVGLRDRRGMVTVLSGPRSQIKDFIAGRNGLVDHAPLKGLWVPDERQRQEIRNGYEAWVPDLATGVFRGEEQVYCYAWYEFGRVRCDVRRLGEGLGGKVTWDKFGAHLFDETGREVPLTTGRLETDYYRADVREIAEAFGYAVKWVPAPDGNSTRVYLSK